MNPADVLALARQGRLREALALGDTLLARSAPDPRLSHLVGVIACQAGNPAKGATLLHKAHVADPGNPEIAFNYAKALADSGEAERAGQMASQFRSDPRMQQLAAQLSRIAGDPVETEAALRRALHSRPDDSRALNNLGSAVMAQGRAEEALELFQRARRIAPDQIAILRNVARAQQLLGREQDALDTLSQAHQRAPDDAAVLRDHGEALLRLLLAQEALAVLAQAARLDPREPSVYVSIGLAYAALGEFDRAEEAYRQTLRLDPDHRLALLNLGILLEQSNRVEALRDLLAAASARSVTGPELDFLTASMLRRDGAFAEALALARAVPEDTVDEALHAQLVAQLADRSGDAGLAFDQFTRMNEAVRNSPVGRRYTGCEHREWVIGQAEMITPEWAAQWPAADRPGQGEGARPAFLVGFPRSGTTLLDTALMGHPAISVIEEQPVLKAVADLAEPLGDIRKLSAGQIAILRHSYGEEAARHAPDAKGLVLDKMPLNLLRGPLLARLFPTAPILFAIRHPCDAVLSCYMQNFRINQAMASFLTLRDAARFYDAAMGYWTQCRALLPLNVAEVRYEDLVADRNGELRRIVAFLGLDWDDAVLRHEDTAMARGIIRTPSYAQVTEGIYRRAAGRWERYRAHLAPVMDVLAPWAIRFGYGDPREP